MFATTITYDFVLDHDVHVKGCSLWTKTVSEQEQPKLQGSHFATDLENVDTIFLSDGRIFKVFWDQEAFGPQGDMMLLMKGPRDVALILTFEEQILIARSEPTLDGRIGISIANEHNKVLFTGMGDIVEIQEPKELQFIAHFEKVYSWRASSPSGCATCTGSVRKDNPKGQGFPPDPQPPDGGPGPDAGPDGGG